ncbi:MAG: DUF423 domain-containing protein [Thermogutta sp.]|nr:DUF423 domain-containing protein [Thermogutta sp.]
MQGRILLFCGAILGAFGVALAAMGDHLVRGGVDAVAYHGFETAVRYQMFHALALLTLGVWSRRQPSRWIAAAAILFLLGTAAFSGGLYLRIVFPQIDWVWIVPVGGTLLIVGWLVAAAAAFAGRAGTNPDSPCGPADSASRR